MRGRALSLSAPRRLVIDLMRFSVAVPRVTVQRRMNLGPVLKARSAATQRASWTAIFLRGYSLVALENPEFRRAYLKCPWPQLYEYPSNVASIAHERELNGERAVLLSRIKSPEKRSIAELDAMIAKARSKPVFEIGRLPPLAAICRASRSVAVASHVAWAQSRKAASYLLWHISAVRVLRSRC